MQWFHPGCLQSLDVFLLRLALDSFRRSQCLARLRLLEHGTEGWGSGATAFAERHTRDA